jgi:hypothetical protein
MRFGSGSAFSYNLGNLPAAGAAAGDRGLVAYQPYAETGEDGRTAGKACTILLANDGGMRQT